ncbi:MAG: adenylate/guanylate cyclase domain-containing protein [Myxococcota bacterium]|nr:adenylate/guanylate cyclase domain-containing protein [Myxococcota bacterium]MDW8361871.1 adenylate/guanylate cyclase domain-containing protein [Myxococcales bacterium]
MHVDERVKGSEQRLWSLIEARAVPGADVRRIDQRIWDLFGETWAVLVTDLAGFSRQAAAFGIIHFLQIIHEKRKLLLPVAADHDGIVLKMEADSLMVLFRKAASAVRCAVEMQRVCQRTSERRSPEEQLLLCVGIGYGRVLRVGDTDVWGSEVNAASKLGEDVAKAGEILVTEAVREAAGDLPEVQYVDLGLAVPGSAQNHRVRYAR